LVLLHTRARIGVEEGNRLGALRRLNAITEFFPAAKMGFKVIHFFWRCAPGALSVRPPVAALLVW